MNCLVHHDSKFAWTTLGMMEKKGQYQLQKGQWTQFNSKDGVNTRWKRRPWTGHSMRVRVWSERYDSRCKWMVVVAVE